MKPPSVCAVIDPGAEPELILSAVEKLGCTVDKILLTHGHYDHTGAVAALMEALPSDGGLYPSRRILTVSAAPSCSP